MELPGDIGVGAVTGWFLGEPTSVTIAPSPRVKIVAADNNLQLSVRPRTFSVDPDGHFSARLVATDTGGASPAHWRYRVSIRRGDRLLESFPLAVPSGSTTDLVGGAVTISP